MKTVNEKINVIIKAGFESGNKLKILKKYVEGKNMKKTILT